MKNSIDPRVVWGILGTLAVVVLVLFVRATGDGTVPASAIKAPAPPGGFPAGPRKGTGTVPLPNE